MMKLLFTCFLISIVSIGAAQNVDKLNQLSGVYLRTYKNEFNSEELKYVNYNKDGFVYDYVGKNSPKEIFGIEIKKVRLSFDINYKINVIQITTKEKEINEGSSDFISINKIFEKTIGKATEKGQSDNTGSSVMFYSSWLGSLNFLNINLNVNTDNGKLYSIITLFG